MPRYFFNVEGDSNLDIEGSEMDSLAIAKCEAVNMAGRMICDNSSTFWDTGGLQMTVSDESGTTLFTLDLHGTDASVAIGV